jgi:protein SCO1
MGVVIEGTTATADGGYEVNHSTQVIGFDAERHGRLVWTQGTSIGDFKDDFEKFAASQG